MIVSLWMGLTECGDKRPTSLESKLGCPGLLCYPLKKGSFVLYLLKKGLLCYSNKSYYYAHFTPSRFIHAPAFSVFIHLLVYHMFSSTFRFRILLHSERVASGKHIARLGITTLFGATFDAQCSWNAHPQDVPLVITPLIGRHLRNPCDALRSATWNWDSLGVFVQRIRHI
jgi:hypothetical protein